MQAGLTTRCLTYADSIRRVLALFAVGDVYASLCKKALTLHLARSEGHERYFRCNLMHCKVLASFHQHLTAEAPLRVEPLRPE